MKIVINKLINVAIVLNIIYPKVFSAEKEPNIVYILIWTTASEKPFNLFRNGQETFIRKGCPKSNCFITNQPSYLCEVTDFDVVMFNLVNLEPDMALPPNRTENQKYVLVALEPAGIYKVPSRFNEFFNLTWSYKLDSDIPFPYFVVKDEHNVTVGPRTEMHWVKNMDGKSEHLVARVETKRIAAAWFETDCDAHSDRLTLVEKLKEELGKYHHYIDVYGNCGNKLCPAENMTDCNALIESTYYFYLAFEKSLSEDYVTDGVLTALNHFAVLVVYGSANYTRFLPDKSYLNAFTLGPAKVAHEMIKSIQQKQKYYDFFKWHGYYSFKSTAEDDYRDIICELCSFFHNETRMSTRSVYHTDVWFNEEHDGGVPVIYGITPYQDMDEEKPSDTTDFGGLIAKIYSGYFSE